MKNRQRLNQDPNWQYVNKHWRTLMEAVEELSDMADLIDDPNTQPQQRVGTEDLFYEFASKLEEWGALPYVLDGIKAIRAPKPLHPEDEPYRITSPGKVYEGRFVHPPGWYMSTEQAIKLNTHYWHVLTLADKGPYEETYEAVMAAPVVTPSQLRNC
jgi:hypothetical protein